MSDARVDPHVKLINERVRSRAISRGLDAIVYAPHFTQWPEIVETARRYSDETLLVVPGRELFTGPWHDRRHVLALGLSDPIPDFLPLETTLSELDRQEAGVIVPHPGYLSMSMSREDIREHTGVIDAIEVFNPKFLPWHGPRARRLVSETDHPVIASSYAHLASTVGIASVGLSRPVSTQDDVVDAIVEGAIEAVSIPPRRSRLHHQTAEMAHLLWENTGAKTRRMLQTDHVATHPSASIYAGRFDADVV